MPLAAPAAAAAAPWPRRRCCRLQLLPARRSCLRHESVEEQALQSLRSSEHRSSRRQGLQEEVKAAWMTDVRQRSFLSPTTDPTFCSFCPAGTLNVTHLECGTQGLEERKEHGGVDTIGQRARPNAAEQRLGATLWHKRADAYDEALSRNGTMLWPDDLRLSRGATSLQTQAAMPRNAVVLSSAVQASCRQQRQVTSSAGCGGARLRDSQ